MVSLASHLVVHDMHMHVAAVAAVIVVRSSSDSSNASCEVRADISATTAGTCMELRKHHSHNILSRLAPCRSAVDSKRQQLTVKGLIEIGCTVKGLIGMGNFRISTLNCNAFCGYI